MNGTGQLVDCLSSCSEGDIRVPGGWPEMRQARRELNIPARPDQDDDGNGYTNLEDWLHSLSESLESERLEPRPPAIKKRN